jgi:hypothetical protein
MAGVWKGVGLEEGGVKVMVSWGGSWPRFEGADLVGFVRRSFVIRRAVVA